jgi:ABC-type glycerol-3-phosphate transport system substrate-binding protein
MLAINAKSTHSAAAWEFIQYLDSPKVQQQRAIATGDPPARLASYNQSLFAQAPYFRQVQAIDKFVVPRPVTPNYPQISTYLQTMISSVVLNLSLPSRALSTAAGQVKPLA